MLSLRQRLAGYARWYVSYLLVGAAFLLLFYLRFRDDSWTEAESRDHPVNTSEEKVARKILDGIETATFRRFGPHVALQRLWWLP